MLCLEVILEGIFGAMFKWLNNWEFICSCFWNFTQSSIGSQTTLCAIYRVMLHFFNYNKPIYDPHLCSWIPCVLAIWMMGFWAWDFSGDSICIICGSHVLWGSEINVVIDFELEQSFSEIYWSDFRSVFWSVSKIQAFWLKISLKNPWQDLQTEYKW